MIGIMISRRSRLRLLYVAGVALLRVMRVAVVAVVAFGAASLLASCHGDARRCVGPYGRSAPAAYCSRPHPGYVWHEQPAGHDDDVAHGGGGE